MDRIRRFFPAALLAVLLAACFSCLAEGSGLPALRLSVDPEEFRLVLSSPDHTYRAEGGALTVEAPGGSPETFPLAYLRGRGNSTWLNRKKPFKIRLQRGADLLGMGSNRHWVLLAEAVDGSLLRNRLMSYAGRAFGLAFTPEMAPVELYVNGEYLGCYTLSQQVRKGKTRVNIGDAGFLLSMSPYEEEPAENVLATSRGVRFLCEDPVFFSPDPSDDTGTAAQNEEIASLLQRAEDAVFAAGETEASLLSCAEYMDLHAAAKYWWIEEFFMNGDGAFTPSTYLYADGGRLYWGPLWDFDLSLPSAAPAEGFNTVRMPWFDHLRAFCPGFRAILEEEWSLLRPVLLDMAGEGGVIDRWTEEIRPAWERNAAAGFADESLEQDSLDSQASRIKDLILRRAAWVDAHLPDLAEAWVEAYFYSADGEYLSTARIPLPSGCIGETDFPEPPVPDGYRFAGWVTDGGAILRPGDRPDTDVNVRASCVPAE